MSESQKRKNTIIAKVLIHDSSDKAVQFLKSLCDEKELIGLRAIEGDLIEFMLDPIISADISALFLMEAVFFSIVVASSVYYPTIS